MGMEQWARVRRKALVDGRSKRSVVDGERDIAGKQRHTAKRIFERIFDLAGLPGRLHRGEGGGLGDQGEAGSVRAAKPPSRRWCVTAWQTSWYRCRRCAVWTNSTPGWRSRAARTSSAGCAAMARSKEALLAEELGVMQELPECFGMSTESNRMLLKHHLKKLRLPTIRREWEAAAASG